MVIRSTFMGGSLAKGACPCASSRMVIPKDQISARLLYLMHRSKAMDYKLRLVSTQKTLTSLCNCFFVFTAAVHH